MTLDHETRIQQLQEYYARIEGGKPPRRAGGRVIPVACVETGRMFESYTEAGDSIGESSANIRRAVMLGSKCGGFHWRRLDKGGRS